MKKFCPLCGTKNEEDARFCKACNEPLGNIQENKEVYEISRKSEKGGLFKLFSKKTPLFNCLKVIANAAFGAVANGKNNNDILNILKQGLKFINKSTVADIEYMNNIASLLARPGFGEIKTAIKFWERIVELEIQHSIFCCDI